MGLDIYLCKSENVDRVKELYALNATSEAEDNELEALEVAAGAEGCEYLRSSYNSAGYNTVAKERGWPTFYALFNVNHGDYIVTPDWADVQRRATEALSTATVPTHCTVPLRSGFSQPEVSNAKEAMDAFVKEMSNESWFSCYTNHTGEFFRNGLTIEAVIYSRQELPFSPSAYLIVRNDVSADEDYYLKSLQTVKAMADYVLSQPEPQKYYLHWSG